MVLVTVAGIQVQAMQVSQGTGMLLYQIERVMCQPVRPTILDETTVRKPEREARHREVFRVGIVAGRHRNSHQCRVIGFAPFAIAPEFVQESFDIAVKKL